MLVNLSRFFIFAFLAAAPARALDAATQPISASGAIDSAFHQLQESLKGDEPAGIKDQRLSDALVHNFDFPELSRRCVGESWKEATGTEQSEFASLFQGLLLRSFLAVVRRHMPSAQLSILEQTEKGDRAHVRALITIPDGKAKTDFWMSRTGGKWRLHNIVVENFSLEKLYSFQFAAAAKTSGVAGLIALLRQKA